MSHVVNEHAFKAFRTGQVDLVAKMSGLRPPQKTPSPTEEAEMLVRRKSAIPRSWRIASVQRRVMKNLVAQLSKDVVQREETRMPNSRTTFSKSTTWMPSVDAGMVLLGDKSAKNIRTAETWRGPKTECCERRRYLTKPAGSGVGALVAQNRYQRHKKKTHERPGTEAKSNEAPGPANQSDQQAKQRNADQPEPTRHPSLGSWNVILAVGREQLYLSAFERVPVLGTAPLARF